MQRNTILLVGLFAYLFIQPWLIGCASRQYPITSPYYTIPAGTRIVVNKSLTIPAGHTRVYMQGGKVVSQAKLDQYYAHCWFRSWKLLETEQTIEPGIFVVTASQKYENYVNTKAILQVAAIKGLAGIRVGDGPMAIEQITTLTIHSDKQPDIRQFSCNRWDEPVDSDHLTVAEMRVVLGTLVEIKPAKVNDS